MKPGAFLFSLTLLSASPALLGQTGYDQQLTHLTAQRDKALSAATEPIFRRYRTALEELLQKATRANDLEAAMKIKTALEASERLPIGSKFQGRWAHNGIKSRLEFSLDGTFQEFWNDQVQKGRWDELTKKVVRVTMDNGAVHEYHLSDDGGSVKRTKEGYIWKRTGITKDGKE